MANALEQLKSEVVGQLTELQNISKDIDKKIKTATPEKAKELTELKTLINSELDKVLKEIKSSK